ncbi:right-handed parallel beta-helix repeat-containing protein [Marinicella litoralis]|uniref:CSLREA domain-containing protein n=1 Tax=Marinicella litoralis TaxID=644220 RepID=A0A4R6XZR7_9GAMM|nr:right-handed parallel beta-helix repeat-containing protein [Marinicella litoralis]TDR23844.1 CSLREA domain-containing protein [Marinicella litoralis]
MKLLILTCLFLVAGATSAAIFQVNLTVQDHVDDNPGDGVCDIPTGGFCTLRAAVMEANALAGTDIIVLPGNATIRLTRTGSNENAAVTGDLDITESVAIGTFVEDIEDFPTVDANGLSDRVFHVLSNSGLVSFLSFKIINGSSDSNGGAINISTGNEVEINQVWFEDNTANSGGAIYLSPLSELEVVGSVLVGNAAVSQGGALTIYGATDIKQSTVFENLNFNNDQQEAIFVGYDAIADSSQLTLRNSTVFDNDRTGIYAVAADVFIRNSTIANHQLGFGVAVNPGATVPELNIRNSVFNLNNVDCSHGIIDLSVDNWNISSDTSCLSGGSTNLTEDPKLTALKVDADNWHRYYRPGFFSPVVDSAHPSAPGPGIGCEAVDQRGVMRAQDGDHNGTARCDRGAIELLDDVIYYDDFDIQY